MGKERRLETLLRVARAYTRKGIIRIWPLPVVDPWFEDWFENEEWYKKWWEYHEQPKQAI